MPRVQSIGRNHPVPEFACPWADRGPGQDSRERVLCPQSSGTGPSGARADIRLRRR